MDPSAVLPVVIVVVFWMIVGIFAAFFFGRSLRTPTETEIEAKRELAEAQEKVTPAH